MDGAVTMLSVAEARARILALAAPLPIERAPLIEAAGRTVAEPVAALRAQPAADLSAMDGYAIRHADLPGPWTVIGEAAAGGARARPIGPGEAARIFTGAPLPDGADTVLVQEEAARDGVALRLAGDGPARRGAHVRHQGSDFPAGADLIAADMRATPARIALAAIGGHGRLPVRRRPRVVLLSTGDELVPPGAPTPGAMLPASNAAMLAALIGTRAEVIDGGIVPDRLDALAAAFRDAAGQGDVIVTTGGASVGDHDLVRPALAAAGASLDFWRVAMRPGKPLLAGRLGTAAVLGLPGNPVSAFVTATLFLLPLLDHLAGAGGSDLRTVRRRLVAPLSATGTRAEYLRGTCDGDHVRPLAGQDSAALAALSAADALIERAPHAPPAAAGDEVDVILLA